jgi:protein-tyrosine phosphatase
LRQKFPDALHEKQVVTLHIPDDYELMQPELLDELRAKLAEYIDWP